MFIFPFCVLFVFLAFSAQYESWGLPLAVILIVPLCLLAAIFGLFLAPVFYVVIRIFSRHKMTDEGNPQESRSTGPASSG